MWKNREVRISSLVSLGAILTSYVLLKDIEMEVWRKNILLAVPLLLWGVYVALLYYRYQKIKSFTEYLNQIQNGEYTLPIEENREGELSILQNEVYKVTKRLIEQAELLNEKTHFLSDSLSNISHQLKTPVTSLLMMADLLQQPDLPMNKRVQFTENMITGLERMQWLVQGLLQLAKLDSGSVLMKRDMIRVSELVYEAIRPLKILADEKDIEIVTEGNDTVTFTGDFAWSIEAFSNIIKNCIEHTNSGGTIKITYAFNSLSTSISIADNGEGIGKEDLYHIFERFYKGANASSNSVGIGLALAKEIITRQRGTILVESEPEEGTEFQIKFYEQ